MDEQLKLEMKLNLIRTIETESKDLTTDEERTLAKKMCCNRYGKSLANQLDGAEREVVRIKSQLAAFEEIKADIFKADI